MRWTSERSKEQGAVRHRVECGVWSVELLRKKQKKLARSKEQGAVKENAKAF